MAEEEKDVTPGDDTPAAPSAEQNNDRKGSGGKEPMIPKHRLDEESSKRQEAEARALKAEQSAQASLASSKAVEEKLANLASALAGGDMSQNKVDSEVAKLAAKHGVPADFFEDMLAIAEKRAITKLEPTIKMAQSANQETGFKKEFDTLLAEVPDATDMTPEEVTELKAMAFKKEFWNVPLKTLYRDMTYDKPRGKSRTAESGRGGSRATKDGPPDISGMSLADFEKYSNDLGKRAM